MKRGMGTASNFKLFIITFLIFGTLIISISITASSGGMAVWPAKLTITLPEDFPEQEITHRIMVENRDSSDLKVKATMDNPTSETKKKGYTLIPDLSWITITPDTETVPPGEARYLNIFINIPDEEKSKQYNQSWEAWVVISEILDASSRQTAIRTELAVKLFINTPPEKEKISDYVFILIGLSIIFLIAILASSHIRKKRSKTNRNKTAVYYYEKK